MEEGKFFADWINRMWNDLNSVPPPDGVEVLVVTERGLAVAVYDAKLKMWSPGEAISGSDADLCATPTHWMELQRPPK